MKLWQKISLLTAAILLISMVVYGGITVYETSNYNIRQTSSAASRQVRATAYALGQSLENAATEEMSDTARKAYLQFLLRRYSSRDYMLLQDWQLAANTTNFELTGNRLEQFDSYEPVAAFQQKNGRHLMIVGQKIPLSDSKNTSYQLLLVRDISEIYSNVLTQIGMFLVILGAIVAVAINAVFWMIRRMLKPLRDLRETAGAISQGQLDRRVRVRSNDEVGALSVSFNQMADQIECQMEELAQVSERRKQLLGSLAHELKTPITSMKVLADSLLAQPDAPVELYQEFMADIAEEIDRENKIITDLLSLVKMDKKAADLHIENKNINELLELIIKRLTPIADKQDINLVLESFRPVNAEVDETKLTLALSNLVENAIKYNKEGGWVHVSLNVDNKYFYVKVEDSGIGIPKESQDAIFERFYRVDKSHSREIGGTGLGLAITRSAILMHRGAIKVYSKEGEGTTFTVRIPLIYVN